MANIYCSYTILNPQRVYKPNDPISGIFYIQNKDKKWEKERVLKKVEVHIYDIYKEYKPHKIRVRSWGGVILRGRVRGFVPERGGGVTWKLWVDHQDRLGEYKFKRKHPIKPGETKEFKFEFKLPTWAPKTSKKFRGWHLVLLFMQKTGLFLNLGKNPQAAFYIIPVQHSTKTGSSVSSHGEEEKSLVLEAVKKEKLQKLRDLMQNSTKVTINDIIKILNLKRSEIIDRLGEWSKILSFNVEGDYVVFQKESISDFFNTLNNMTLCPYCLSEIGMDVELCWNCGPPLRGKLPCCDSPKILEEDGFYICLNCGFVYSRILDDNHCFF